MPETVKEIIALDRRDFEEVHRLQLERLALLAEMKRKKERGEPVDTQWIIEELQGAGILDENGDLAEPYRPIDA